VCWPVEDENGERFLIKDHWMSEGRTPEYELLEQAKLAGVQGVCSIIAFELGRGQTKDFRGPIEDFGEGYFHNRVAIRITMKAYGASIDKFTSPEEMLAALRDAITGE
jgi:hypothetical protein